MTRDEFLNAFNRVVLITIALVLACYVLLVGVIILIGLEDAWLHYTIATVFTLILAPTAAFPLVVMYDRLSLAKVDLESLLRIDGLTELPNRRAFFEKAEQVFANDNAISLMMVDIDHFKSVNDSYGHGTGDRVLCAVAQSIQQVVAAAPGTGVKLAARIGGEEFAVLVEGLSPVVADGLAQALVEKVRQSPVRGGAAQPITVTISVGVAHRRPGDNPDAVLRAADNACYRAKRLGRNQWRDADIVDEKVAPVTVDAMTAA